MVLQSQIQYGQACCKPIKQNKHNQSQIHDQDYRRASLFQQIVIFMFGFNFFHSRFVAYHSYIDRVPIFSHG